MSGEVSIDRGWRDHVLIMGPPGAGKTLWAREQARKVPIREWGSRSGDGAYIARLCGIEENWRKNCGIVADGFRAPFRAPHHSVSLAGLVGTVSKGWRLRPGEVSLAHGGVLLLDEAQEFKREALEAVASAARLGKVLLRTTLEGPTLPVPAEFRLVVACNACPCGRRGQPRHQEGECRCTEAQIARYMGRLGPLLELCRVVPADEWQREVKEIGRRRESEV